MRFITSQYINLLLLVVFPIGLLLFWIVLRRALRLKTKLFKPRPADQCKCGYPLKNLSLPRCPECGRVSGFDSTPEELGIGVEELEKIQAARTRRNRS